MHHPTDRITHTTAFVTRVMEHWLEREHKKGKHLVQSKDASLEGECSLQSTNEDMHVELNDVHVGRKEMFYLTMDLIHFI